MKIINKIFFGFIIIVWLVLWLIFIIRENKPGDYSDLRYLYSHPAYTEKIRYLMGEDIYDFLWFCKNALPENATYKLALYQRSDFEELRARYFLWPLKMTLGNPNFIICYHSTLLSVSGYKLFKQYKDSGFILVRERK